jgi:hypothetical protein
MKLKYFLTTILFLLAIILLYYFGIFSDYNFVSAKKDIKKGKYQFVLLEEDYDIYKDEKKIANKYGFDVLNIEYTFFNSHNNIGIKTYNKIMDEKIQEKIGREKYNKYLAEMDSLQKEILKFVRP